jgi:UDP-4-amino-4-deoxy-L-arabinose-oxoglutarate aminotransferase
LNTTKRVEFYRHSVTEADIAAVGDALRSVFLTTGPRAAAFESAFAEYLGAQHVVTVSSCTSALFLSLTALGVGRGDEVITTPMTFVATANAILHTGATPVLVDVEPDTGNIDVARVERAITSRTRVVIPVHLYGLMADLQALTDVCQRRNVLIVEDAAHAAEAERDGARPGRLGQAACFSFYATKNLTCGEGGAVATNDPALAMTLRRLRSHGLSKEAAGRYTERYQHWDMLELGFKANLSDINAALLTAQLPRLDTQLERREAIAQRYEEAFSTIRGVGFPTVPRGARSARHLFTIWVPPGRRDNTIAALEALGIGVAVNYRALHLTSYYRSLFGFARGAFPHAERIGDGTITLPLYPSMTDEEVEHVIDAVRDVAASWGRSHSQIAVDGRIGATPWS